MPETFFTKRQRFNEALERADAALCEARGLLDDLPSIAVNEKQVRQILDAHQALRESLRSHQRHLEKM